MKSAKLQAPKVPTRNSREPRSAVTYFMTHFDFVEERRQLVSDIMQLESEPLLAIPKLLIEKSIGHRLENL